MSFNRREFLTFLGIGFTSTACNSFLKDNLSAQNISKNKLINNSQSISFHNFKPVNYPIPLEVNNLPSEEQKKLFSTYEVQDDLVLPEGFKYEVIAAWGDRVGDSRFGYNNDYLSFIETSPNEGFLTINFEYVSLPTWLETYPLVINKQLDQGVLQTLISANNNRQVLNIFGLPNDDPVKVRFQEFFKEILIDQGIGIISLKRNSQGKWQRTYSPQDRRITGISGLDNPNQLLKVTGSAQVIFNKQEGLGYLDGLGAKIIGTFANCAGGTTPWGTVFSAEENFQNYVPEAVMADGTSFPPFVEPVTLGGGAGNPFGLAGNKYGWMVEVDPANPNDYGTKHTWLGRFRHEAVAIRAETNQPLVFYSGCDRTGGHIYKFISKGNVTNPQDKNNSKLLNDGMLYVAKFNPEGTGKWIDLAPETAINPDSPQDIFGEMLPLPNPNRQTGGFIAVQKDDKIAEFKAKFKTLKDLYIGETEEEIQGAILIDAHFAGNAIGGTCTARPEDVAINPRDKGLFIAFTAGVAGSDGGSDKRIFGDEQNKIYKYGCIMRLDEENRQPASLNFTWQIMAVGGEPSEGGLGFANPDNLEFDSNGDLWMVTDMSTGIQNQTPNRIGDDNFVTGAFGNNSLWYIPLSGENAGKAYPFGIAPMETEATGPFFSQDQQTLFLAIQHPGEKNGMRKDLNSENREISLLTTDGQEFKQNRVIPVGSNFPSSQPNQPPKPSVVAIQLS